MKLSCILLLAVSLPGLLSAGSFQLERRGEDYRLVADQALLSDILAEIDRQETASLQFFGDDSQLVSASYQGVTIDQLLYKLGVSYVLVYEPDDDGTYKLGDAVMLDSNASGVDSSTAAEIRKLVRDLRDDDVPHNALRAYYELMERRCQAASFLEEALYDGDFQCRHAAAQLLRASMDCPNFKVSDRLIEVTFEALDQEHDQSDLAECIWLGDGYRLLQETGVYARVRNRILNNLNGTNGRARLYSSLLAAQHGESTYMHQLARILIPHLADNDLHGDAAVSAHALFQLGPAALPYLQSHRNSPDRQQAEMTELICTALETGETPRFNPTMYYGYSKNPVIDEPWPMVTAWNNDRFPDANGQYHNLAQPRQTAADVYGTNPDHELHYAFEPEDIDEAEPFPYVVKPGDTLENISNKFAASPESIKTINPQLPADSVIKPGMRILIPWQ
jgi:LysM domain